MSKQIFIKPLAHFATHRSGSVAIGILLEYALEQKFDILGLGDFFELRPEFQLPRDRQYLKYSKGQNLQSRIQRWRWLRSQTTPYFFTFYPGLPPSIDQGILKTYDLIFSERKNLPEQILSFLLVSATGEFYPKFETSSSKELFVAKKQDFKRIEAQIFLYQRIKAQLKPKYVLYYEDFCLLNPNQFLAPLKLGPLRSPKLGFHSRVLKGPKKEERFKNLGEIKAWYRDSFLDKIHKWDIQE